MTELLERLRALGLPMTSRYSEGQVVGWTTDKAKADAAQAAGATLCTYTSSDPRFSGWEVICRDAA